MVGYSAGYSDFDWGSLRVDKMAAHSVGHSGYVKADQTAASTADWTDGIRVDVMALLMVVRMVGTSVAL